MNRRDVPNLLTRLQDALNVAHVIAPSGASGRCPSIKSSRSTQSSYYIRSTAANAAHESELACIHLMTDYHDKSTHPDEDEGVELI
jgi:hypothetical protein